MAPRLSHRPHLPRLPRRVSGAVERERALQALNQEKEAFEQLKRENAETFRLQRAMGWMTFVIVPASLIVAVIEPVTLTALVPINALAYWNWRRLLRREPRPLRPTTRPPTESDDSNPSGSASE